MPPELDMSKPSCVDRSCRLPSAGMQWNPRRHAWIRSAARRAAI